MTDPAATEPGSSAETPTPSRPRLSGCAWILICVVLIVATTAFSVLWPIYRGKRAYADLEAKGAEFSHWSSYPDRAWYFRFVDEETYVAGVDSLGVFIEGDQFDDEDVPRLVALDPIEDVAIVDTQITGHGLRGLAAIRDLNSLIIDQPSLSDADLVEILKPEWNLFDLQLASPLLTQSAWEPLSRSATVSILALRCPGMTIDGGLPELASMKSAHYLSLSQVQITADGLNRLGTLPKCRMLNLRDCRTTSLDLSRFLSLDMLSLIDCELIASGAGAWRIPSKVGDIELVRTPLDAIGPEAFEADSVLSSLNIKECTFGDAFLNVLTGCKELTSLKLTGCPHVGDSQLPIIAAIPNLKSLKLIDTGVTAAGIEQLKAARPEAKIYANVKLD